MYCRNKFNYTYLVITILFLEICSNDELPEVELISLLEETIPQYKLRADTLTQFTGINEIIYFCLYILLYIN